MSDTLEIRERILLTVILVACYPAVHAHRALGLHRCCFGAEVHRRSCSYANAIMSASASYLRWMPALQSCRQHCCVPCLLHTTTTAGCRQTCWPHMSHGLASQEQLPACFDTLRGAQDLRQKESDHVGLPL